MTWANVTLCRCQAQKYLTLAQFIDGQVGDFEVATGGGFWVAARVYGGLLFFPK
jgi:hypothetical protein